MHEARSTGKRSEPRRSGGHPLRSGRAVRGEGRRGQLAAGGHGPEVEAQAHVGGLPLELPRRRVDADLLPVPTQSRPSWERATPFTSAASVNSRPSSAMVRFREVSGREGHAAVGYRLQGTELSVVVPEPRPGEPSASLRESPAVG